MDDGGARKAAVVAGGLSFAAGVAILNPGFKDAAISWLNKAQRLGLYEPPPAAGWLLVAIGLFLLVFALLGADRVASAVAYVSGQSRATTGTLVAIKQTGFQPAVPDLQPADLPAPLRRRAINIVRVDLGEELAAQPPELDRALARQLRMPGELAAVRGGAPDHRLAYCGIVQAPFQLLAGYQLSGWAKLLPFEWSAPAGRWEPL